MWKFRCIKAQILERQLLLRGRAFATFSTIEKGLAGLKKVFASRMRRTGRMLCRAGRTESSKPCNFMNIFMRKKAGYGKVTLHHSCVFAS